MWLMQFEGFRDHLREALQHGGGFRFHPQDCSESVELRTSERRWKVFLLAAMPMN